jgi:sulfate permease, SulP family
MFFGAVENFERVLLQTHTDPTQLILRLRQVPFMDITGIQTLEAVIRKLRKRDVRVMLSEANERVLGKLRNAGVLDALAEGDCCASLKIALQRAAAHPSAGPKVPGGLGEIARRFIDTSKSYLHREGDDSR